MSMPISATPTLTGEDAKRFVAAALNPQPKKPPKSAMVRNIPLIEAKLKAREQK
jgi:hypothetical protein